MTLGEEAREKVRAYQARTGLSVGQVGRLAGFAHQTMMQFMADRYPNPDNSIARQITKALEENPPEVADVEGRLYTTHKCSHPGSPATSGTRRCSLAHLRLSRDAKIIRVPAAGSGSAPSSCT